MRILRLSLAVSFSVLAASAASGGERFRYKEGEHAKGRLTYVGKSPGFAGVPVLFVEGSPEEMGEQIGVLAIRQVKRQDKPLFDFPRDYFRLELTRALRRLNPKSSPQAVEKWAASMEKLTWAKCQTIAAKLEPNFPKIHLAELDALIKAGGMDRKQLIVGNGMFDLGHVPPQRLLFGCSSLIIPPRLSSTGGLLFGRNLDFHHLGYLHHYSLLMVHRPSDNTKHAFVSAGFPGLVGCFTGMNDAGLTIASHEVFEPKVKRPFNEKGVPFAMAYRRVLEECTTVEKAVELLKSIKRASVTSLVIADVKKGAVIEVTPDAVAVRKFDNKPGVCTNHFCTKGFKNPKQTDAFHTLKRFDTLSKSVAKVEELGVQDVKERMHLARLVDEGNDLTIQTFVFEPAARKLHVRFANEKAPATAGKLTTLDLRKLWGK